MDTYRPRRRRGGVVAAVFVVVLLAMVSFYGWRAEWFGSPATVNGSAATSPPSPTATSISRREGLDAVLTRRGNALIAGDRAGWLDTADPHDAEFVEGQGRWFDQLVPIRLSKAQYVFAGEGPGLSVAQQGRLGAEAWVAKVVFAYRIEGADEGDVRREQYLTMVPRDGNWYVAGTSDGPTAGIQRDLWDLGPVYTARGKRALVIGNSPHGLDDLVEQFDLAAEQVDSVWGRNWPRTVVAIAPQTQTEMAMLLGRADETGLSKIAAVTTGEVGLPAGETADRVIVNPAGFAELTLGLSKQDVLTHEVTHVATRAAGPGDVPTWFSEGFADYVAYADRDYPLRLTAGDVLRPVAEGAPPPTLPTQADFDPAQRSEVTQSYSAAYLAIVYLDRAYSREAVLELYRAQAGAAGPGGTPSTPVPLAQALPQVTGLDLETFEQRYQDFVRAVAQEES